MADKLYSMKIEPVPYSSVVGSSLQITDPKLGLVALLMISVPQPRLDYRTVADAVSKAVLNGHVSGAGATLVLPDDFGTAKSKG